MTWLVSGQKRIIVIILEASYGFSLMFEVLIMFGFIKYCFHCFGKILLIAFGYKYMVGPATLKEIAIGSGTLLFLASILCLLTFLITSILKK